MSEQSTQKKDASANEAASGNQAADRQTPEVDDTAQGIKETISEEAAEVELDSGRSAGDLKGTEEAVHLGEESGEETETSESAEETYRKQLAEKEDKYMRLAAEFENYKKRSAQEMLNRIKFASQPLALSIIAGLDNLERALDQAREEENKQLKEFIRGVEMVQQQFYDALKQNNIERVYPKGEPFDPNKHEAMSVIDTEDVEPDHIAEVFQAGYYLHDRVIRPAMVQVAKKK